MSSWCPHLLSSREQIDCAGNLKHWNANASSTTRSSVISKLFITAEFCARGIYHLQAFNWPNSEKNKKENLLNVHFCTSFFLCINSLNSVLFKRVVGHQPFFVSISLCFTYLLRSFSILLSEKQFYIGNSVHSLSIFFNIPGWNFFYIIISQAFYNQDPKFSYFLLKASLVNIQFYFPLSLLLFLSQQCL